MIKDFFKLKFKEKLITIFIFIFIMPIIAALFSNYREEERMRRRGFKKVIKKGLLWDSVEWHQN